MSGQDIDDALETLAIIHKRRRAAAPKLPSVRHIGVVWWVIITLLWAAVGWMVRTAVRDGMAHGDPAGAPSSEQ